MLEINVKDIRELKFEMEISGITASQLEGRLRLNIDNIEYGIPAKISETAIIVDIPPLKRIVQRELEEGEVFSARLDIFGDSHYMKPWQGEFKIKNPVIVEAALQEERPQIDKPQITLKVSDGGDVAKEKLNEMKEAVKTSKTSSSKPKRFKDIEAFKQNLTKEDVIGWLAKNGTKNPEIQSLVYEQTASQVGSTKPYKILVELQQVYKVTKK